MRRPTRTEYRAGAAVRAAAETGSTEDAAFTTVTGVDGGPVVVSFSRPMDWMALDPDTARALARTIFAAAMRADGGT